MDLMTKQKILDLIIYDNKGLFVSYLIDEINSLELNKLLDDLKPYLTQYLKDNGVFDEEATKIALQDALNYEKGELEKRNEEMKNQKDKICDLEKKIKEWGVEL